MQLTTIYPSSTENPGWDFTKPNCGNHGGFILGVHRITGACWACVNTMIKTEHPRRWPTNRMVADRDGIDRYSPTKGPCPHGDHPIVRAVHAKRGCLNCRDLADQVVTREDALRGGVLFYRPLAPCSRGHRSIHYARNGACLECLEQRRHGHPSSPRVPSVIDRDAARAAGLARYFDGIQCPAGHVAERYTRTTECVECRRIYNQGGRPPIEKSEIPCSPAGITRWQARELGFKRYTPATPCKNGHLAPRYTSTGNCLACLGVGP